MDAKDFIMNTPAPPQQRAQDRGTYVPAQGLLNLQKALGPQGGKLVGRLTGGDAKAWNNAAHKLGIPARTLIAAFYNSSDYVKSCPDIAARLLSGEAVFNGEKIFTADEADEPVDAPVAADEGPHGEMPDRVRQHLRAQLAQMRGEVPESKAVYVVKLLLGETEDPTAQASADSARVASEFIRKKSPTHYLKHRSDLEAEKWVTAQKKAAGMAEATTSKQNRYNPKGLVRDHRGNLLDKWGRKMEVDWDEFERRRVKTKDASEPYLKPPAQKNPLHNSARPVRN